jgi:hypothetical protein
MRSWTVHAAAARTTVPVTVTSDAKLLPEGFCWPAFLLGMLWLLGQRQWLVGFAALLLLGALAMLLPELAVLGLAVVHLLLGLSGYDLLRASLARRGLPVVGVVLATDRDAATLRLGHLRPDLMRGLAS